MANRKMKTGALQWMHRGFLLLQGLLLVVLFMHPRVPNSARLLVCGGVIALIVVLYGWSKMDALLRAKLDKFLYERGASLFTIWVLRAILFLVEFGIAISIIVPAMMKLDAMM